MIPKIAKSKKDVREVLRSLEIGDSDFVDDADHITIKNWCTNFSIYRVGLDEFDQVFDLHSDGISLEEAVDQIWINQKTYNDFMRQEIAIQEEEGR